MRCVGVRTVATGRSFAGRRAHAHDERTPEHSSRAHRHHLDRRPARRPALPKPAAGADTRTVKAPDRTASGTGRARCSRCGLVNFASSEYCRRCGGGLEAGDSAGNAAAGGDAGARTLGQWLRWIAGVVLTIAIGAYASLLVSSDGLTHEQQAVVGDGLAVIEEAGFTQEAFALRRLASYRSSDNWWNRYVGHHPAYAATNFPFAVVTLYPAFFRFPVDDVERAAILLHEARHVFGANEQDVLRLVWIEKGRLGWTAARYGHTRVWKNTREWTAEGAPQLFECGLDHQSDCLERREAIAQE